MMAPFMAGAWLRRGLEFALGSFFVWLILAGIFCSMFAEMPGGN